MKKFHTLPGVIPSVGVAEGQGAFARWSLTAGAALLLLLSAEGARGDHQDQIRRLELEISELKAKIITEENPKLKPALNEELKRKEKELATQLKVSPADERVDTAVLPAVAANSASFITPGKRNTPGPQSATVWASTPKNRTIEISAEPPSLTFSAPNKEPRTPRISLAIAKSDPQDEINDINQEIDRLTNEIKELTGKIIRESADTEKVAELRQELGEKQDRKISLTNERKALEETAAGSTTTPVGSLTPGPPAAATNAPNPIHTDSAGGKSTAGYASNRDAWKTKFNGDRKAKQEEAGADPCVISSELGEDRGIYKCAGTRRTLENSQQITAGAVVAGTVSMAMKNQTAVNDALKSGSQSGNLDAQASIQAGQEDISKTIGAIQMTQALMLKSKADSHGKNIRQLEGNLLKKDVVTVSAEESINVANNEDATAALQKFVTTNRLDDNVANLQNVGIGTVRKEQITGTPGQTNLIKKDAAQAVAEDLNFAVKTVGRAAVTEQKAIQEKASEESMKLFQQAAVAFTVAEQARKNKETLRQSAQSVKQVEKATKDLAFQFAPNDRSPNQLAAPNQSLSLSSAQDASQSKTDGLGQNGTDDPTGETPNFDSPYGAPNEPFAPPSPQPIGEFQRNPSGGGGGGGGGGAGGGGTSTQPSNNDDDHAGGGGSTYAKLPTTSDKYGAGGGGVGGSGGGGGNAGMDFTGMLSQFLPKPEDQGPKNGILDFGARAPAQTTLPSSLLDASANLFERVHEAYQSKNRKGQVGQGANGGRSP